MTEHVPAPCLGAGSIAERASPWVRRWSHLVPGGEVLDVACGEGRHLAWFAARGHRVLGVDRSAQALAAVGLPGDTCSLLQADLEQAPWPLPGRRFAAVVVTNYLWRPLMPLLMDSLEPGGVLIYETFALGQEAFGRPSRPEFLLRPGELLKAFESLRVVAYEDGLLAAEGPWPSRVVQRLVAVRPQSESATWPPPLSPA